MSARTDAISAAFLIWLEQHDAAMPRPELFQDEPTSVVDGAQVTDQELERVLRVLVAREMVKGPRIMGRDTPIRVRLTELGQICVYDHDGDMQAWRATTGPSSISFDAGGSMQTAVNSTGVVQVIQINDGPVDLEKFSRAARTLLDEVDTLDLPADELEELRQAGEELHSELEGSAPDHARLRKLGGTIVRLLGTLTASGAASYMVQLLTSAT